MIIQTIIVDDEAPARRELRTLLDDHPQFAICGEAADAWAASELVASRRPALIFLDIELPGLGGISWYKSLPGPRPHVIFTTAYSEFAVHAFELDALDYLVKPIHPARLEAALQRFIRTQTAAGGNGAPVSAGPEEPLAIDSRVFVREGERCWYVPVSRIRLLEAAGNYTRLLFDDDRPLLLSSLTALERRLPPDIFIRANRSQLINVRFIETIGEWFSGSLKVNLKGGGEVEFSRRQAQLFRERMSL